MAPNITPPRIALGLLSLVISAGGSSSAAPAQAHLSIITDADSAPYEMVVGSKVMGITVDIVSAALKQSGMGYDIRVYPWKRAYKMTLEGGNICLTSVIRSAAREGQFQWVGPLVHDEWVAYAKSASKVTVTSIADLRPYRVGAIQGEAISEFLAANGIVVDAVNGVGDDSLGLKKLQSGRIDFWATTSASGDYTVAKAANSDVRKVLSLKEIELYLACSNAVDHRLIETLNANLKKMAADGTTTAIQRTFWENH